MYEPKKNGTVRRSKSVGPGPGPSSYEKRIYRAAVSKRLRNTGLHQVATWNVLYFHFFILFSFCFYD